MMTDTTARIRELDLYRQYFDLVTAGNKTIRFHIKGSDETCEVKVRRVTEYLNFEALFDGEGAANVNPTATREQQLVNNLCHLPAGGPGRSRQ